MRRRSTQTTDWRNLSSRKSPRGGQESSSSLPAKLHIDLQFEIRICQILITASQTWDKILKNFEKSKFWSYWYWFWYWKLQFQNIDFDIDIEICISKILTLILILKFLGLLILILVLILKKMWLILKIWVVRERLVPPGPWVFW